MDIKQSSYNTRDNDVPAIHLPRKNYNMWVDGSFLDKNRNKAGAGAIITDADNDDAPVLALAFNLSNLRIRASKYTELWAATLALEKMSKFHINKITFDSPITKHRIQNIRDKKTHHHRAEKEQWEMPALFWRMKKVLEINQGLDLVHVKRNKEHLPLADKFSRLSATRRLALMFSTAHDQNVPCLYHIVNKEGRVRQTYFYDLMKNYDIDEYIKGPFQREDNDNDCDLG